MINFNDLPSGLVEMIYALPIATLLIEEEISNNKSILNEVMEELNNYLKYNYKSSLLPCILRIHKRHREKHLRK